MAFIGNQPAESFTSFATQEFSTSATTSYTLDHAVANENEIALFVNNVRQQPGSGKAYTATGTALTLSAATASTDTMYCVFLGRALQTVTPATNSITAAMVGNDLISGKDALTSAPADTDEFLVSDAGTLKRIDYSLIKSDPGLALIKEVAASNVASVSFVHGTSDVVFDTTYKAYLFVYSQVRMASDEEVFIRAMISGSAQTSSYVNMQYGSYAGTSAYNDEYSNAFMGSPGDVESDIPLSGFAYVYGAGGSSIYPQMLGQVAMKRSNGNHYNYNFGAYRNSTTSNFDGITFTNNGGGNISSGNFKLYGLK